MGIIETPRMRLKPIDGELITEYIIIPDSKKIDKNSCGNWNWYHHKN